MSDAAATTIGCSYILQHRFFIRVVMALFMASGLLFISRDVPPLVVHPRTPCDG